ncbi:MAG: hypothetical protein HC771_23780 [Synechococcales cyanobacterium CRU_2_2]|nr:hypothetical protein [Synechococcales cyanobacterium CRU_2_2]
MDERQKFSKWRLAMDDLDKNLQSLIDACKEENMTARKCGILPSAIIATGQQNPESGLLSKPMNELLDRAEELFD